MHPTFFFPRDCIYYHKFSLVRFLFFCHCCPSLYVACPSFFLYFLCLLYHHHGTAARVCFYVDGGVAASLISSRCFVFVCGGVFFVSPPFRSAVDFLKTTAAIKGDRRARLFKLR